MNLNRQANVHNGFQFLKLPDEVQETIKAMVHLQVLELHTKPDEPSIGGFMIISPYSKNCFWDGKKVHHGPMQLHGYRVGDQFYLVGQSVHILPWEAAQPKPGTPCIFFRTMGGALIAHTDAGPMVAPLDVGAQTVAARQVQMRHAASKALTMTADIRPGQCAFNLRQIVHSGRRPDTMQLRFVLKDPWTGTKIAIP